MIGRGVGELLKKPYLWQGQRAEAEGARTWRVMAEMQARLAAWPLGCLNLTEGRQQGPAVGNGGLPCQARICSETSNLQR